MISKNKKPGSPYFSTYGNVSDESDKIRDVITFYNYKQHGAKGRAKHWDDTEKKIEFKAYITAFKDVFKSNWTETNVYGRMDPVYNYTNTVRKITLAFDMPAFDIEEAAHNASKVAQLVQYTYPVYSRASKIGDNTGGVNRHIIQSPIIAMKFGNLITNWDDGPISGFLDGFAIDPDLDSGVFKYSDWQYFFAQPLPETIKLALDSISGTSNNVSKQNQVQSPRSAATAKNNVAHRYFFKNYKVSLSFSPIHNQFLGFESAGHATQNAVLFNGFPNNIISKTKELDKRQSAGASNIESLHNQDAFGTA